MSKEEIHACRGHVLVLPFPVQSHINPMLQFSKRFSSKGLKVTLVTTIFITKSMQAARAGPIRIESFSDGYDEGGIKEALKTDEYVKRFKAIGPKNILELIEKQNRYGHPVNCLLYDSVIPWGLNLAKELGLIGAAFYTQSCSVNAIYYIIHKGLISTCVIGVEFLATLLGI
ncbi:UDP-glucuronosyl/UDP-glucosyltransferase [Macleaya cordata]|uniref:UDP-glucuronosyl/UDP-glucosyltransferase n=1 Tax=Macleaya cordata TaxID=56857 RepID=A0A200QJP5_MACCD|nr:UDP-glucuronosyl/UDP-glucosyltransferase [Macleaya cordata]